MNISRITQFAFTCIIAALIVGLSACDELVSILSTRDAPDTLRMEEEIVLGLVLPLTGPAAAPYGFSMQRGFELAREEINNSQLGDVRISFITEDNMTSVDGAVNAFQHLVDQGVPAIVGIAISTLGKQAFPVAQENQVVAFSSVSSAAGLSGIGDYIFRAGLATNILNPSGVKVSHAKLGYSKVAMIYDEADVYSASSNADFSVTLAELGVEVLTTQTFQTGDVDFSEQLTAIMESNPEAILISALAAERVKIMRQARKIGVPSFVSYIVPSLTANQVKILGDAAEGAITFASWSRTSNAPGNQAFVQNYQTKYGIEPDQWAAQSYATLYILAAAIAQVQSPVAPAIRDALAHTKDFNTILGKFSFDPNGEALYQPIVLVVEDGQLEIVGDNHMSSVGDTPGDDTASDDMSSEDMLGDGVDSSN